MLSIVNEVDLLIFRYICFVCDINMCFSYIIMNPSNLEHDARSEITRFEEWDIGCWFDEFVVNEFC